MSETTAIKALEQANSEMDAIFVDDNGSANYLPDLVAGLTDDEIAHGGKMVIAQYVPDEDGVIRGPRKIVLTLMDDDHFRAGHYGTILDTDHPEAAQYA